MASKKGKAEGGLPTPVIAGVVIVLVGVVAFIVFGQKTRYEPVGPGTDSLEFTLPDLDGNPVSLSSFKGKVVFLNFWATWCKPCEDEMPSMQNLYTSLKGRPFEIVAVSVDKDDVEVVRKYAERHGLTFPILHDKKGRVKEMYKTTGVPETFILDQNGVVAEKVWGPRDWSERESLTVIFDLLRKGPQAPESYDRKKAPHPPTTGESPGTNTEPSGA